MRSVHANCLATGLRENEGREQEERTAASQDSKLNSSTRRKLQEIRITEIDRTVPSQAELAQKLLLRCREHRPGDPFPLLDGQETIGVKIFNSFHFSIGQMIHDQTSLLCLYQ